MLFGGQITELALFEIARSVAVDSTTDIATAVAVAAWHAVRFADGDSHDQSQRRCADILGISRSQVRKADDHLDAHGFVEIEGEARAKRHVTIGAAWPMRQRRKQPSLPGVWPKRRRKSGSRIAKPDGPQSGLRIAKPDREPLRGSDSSGPLPASGEPLPFAEALKFLRTARRKIE